MKGSLFVKAALPLFFLMGSLFAAPFNQDGDVQFWEHQRLSVDVSSRTSLYIMTEFRWGADGGILYLSYIQGGVRLKVRDWIFLEPSYRQFSVLNPIDQDRIPIYAPLIDLVVKFKLWGWEIHERNRTEHLIFESIPNVWVYRNRIRAFSPIWLGKMNPFIFEEAFFREGAGFAQNRIGFGGRFVFNKSTSSELYYMHRRINLPTWRTHHVFGLFLHFRY